MQVITCPHCQTHNRVAHKMICGRCKNDLICIDGNIAYHNDRYFWAKAVVYTAVISLSSVVVYEKGVEDLIFAPRYQLMEKYNLMNACISKIDYRFQQKSQICACAITKTQNETPYPPSSSNQKFEDVFRANVHSCAKNNKTR